MNNVVKNIVILIVGIGIGLIEENLRYSIIHHEAKKGDAECQKIVDELDEVGQRIETLMTK